MLFEQCCSIGVLVFWGIPQATTRFSESTRKNKQHVCGNVFDRVKSNSITLTTYVPLTLSFTSTSVPAISSTDYYPTINHRTWKRKFVHVINLLGDFLLLPNLKGDFPCLATTRPKRCKILITMQCNTGPVWVVLTPAEKQYWGIPPLTASCPRAAGVSSLMMTTIMMMMMMMMIDDG